MAHPGGRPTILTEELLTKAREYRDFWYTLKDHLNREPVIPTLEGLALYLDINKDTITEWCKEDGEFSVIADNIRKTKSSLMQQRGLSGDFNSKIAALLLGHEGYREKQDMDVTTGGEKLGVVILPAKDKQE